MRTNQERITNTEHNENKQRNSEHIQKIKYVLSFKINGLYLFTFTSISVFSNHSKRPVGLNRLAGPTPRILPVMGLGSAGGSTLRLYTRLWRGSTPYRWWCDAAQ